jgi:lycopene cyclase domain-containing protein
VTAKNFLYLALDFGAILFPFLFSFYPKAPYYKKWKFLFPSMLIGSGIFLVWDVAFTKMGVWGFNPDYLTGFYLINLPVEEVLFFVCVPYSSIFIYEVVRHFTAPDRWAGAGKMISIFLIFFLGMMGLLNINRWYTAVTFISLSCFLVLSVFRWKSDFLGIFYFSFLFVLIPFFMMNGILTGTLLDAPVVWYNDSENLGIRMGTIPFEDTFYGMLLLLMTVTRMEHLQRKRSMN